MSKAKVFIRKADSKDEWRELPTPDEFGRAVTITPAVYDPTKCYPLHVVDAEPMTFHINLDEKKRRELLNLFYDKNTRRAERCLKDGIRLLGMWQREKEPHRKAYYWHISELKLTRALGNEPLLHFTIDKKAYKLARDIRGNVRIYKNDE